MIIEKINIQSFGLLTDTSLSFAEGINVIEGQNEAGKSTIAAFIKFMLYGFDMGDTSETGDHRYINWDTGRAEGSMLVRVSGRQYLITRLCARIYDGERATYKDDCSIVDMESGTPAFGKAQAGRVFFEVKRDLFENTAYIGSVGGTDIADKAVTESMENILFSAAENYNVKRAEERIRERMETLLREKETGGAIFDLETKEEELSRQLAACNEDNQRILAKEAQLHEIREERRAAEKSRDDLLELDDSYKNVMLIDTFDKLHELEKECEEKTAEYNAFIEENTHNHFVPDAQYLTDLAVARRVNSDAYRAVQQTEERHALLRNAVGITRDAEATIALSDTYGGEEAVTKLAVGAKSKQTRGICLTILSALLLLAAAVFELCATGAAGGVLPRVLVGIGGAGALAGLAVFALSTKKSYDALIGLCHKYSVQTYDELRAKLAVTAEARARRDKTAADTEEARMAAQAAKEQYDTSRKELIAVIMRWGEDPPTAALGTFLDRLEARVAAFLQEKERLYAQKNAIEMTVKEIRRTLSDKSEIDIRACVSPLRRKSLSTINHDEIITGIAAAKAKIAEQDALAFEVENELAVLKSRAKDPGEIVSKIQAYREQIQQLRHIHKAYFLARCTLHDAMEDLRAEVSPRLGHYATELMSIMTNKKYTLVRISDGMKVSYRTENGEERSADFLSGGTRDLAYIALRMALVDMLYAERPPMIFDETFAHQDNRRATSMMAGIAHLYRAEGQQSFIFTCRQRESALAVAADKKAGIFKLSLSDGEDM